MEANLAVLNAPGLISGFNSYFDMAWENSDGLSHTRPFEAWEETGLKRIFKTVIYNFQERLGMGTF
jgi:hypothetical protein